MLMSALLIALPVRAEWVSFLSTDSTEELYDPAFLKSEQGRVSLWTLTNYAKPMTSLEGQEFSSEKTLTTLDCQQKKSGAEKVIRYAGKNAQAAVVSTMETPLRTIRVQAGSPDQILLVRVCR